MGKGGGSPPPVLYLSTESYARGRQSMLISATDFTYPYSYYNGTQLPARGFTMNSNWLYAEDFESYEDDADLRETWGTDYASIVYRTYPSPYLDVSEYTIFSFMAKYPYPDNHAWLGLSLTNHDALSRNSVTTWAGPIGNTWRRYEMVLPSYSYVDYRFIGEVALRFTSDFGYTADGLYLDDLCFIDSREVSKLGTWINLNLTKLTTIHDSATPQRRIAGGFGDSIIPTVPGNAEGKLTTVTSANTFEDENTFIERAKRIGGEVFLRLGEEGFPAYITDVKTKFKDVQGGLQKTCDVTYFEERLVDG